MAIQSPQTPRFGRQAFIKQLMARGIRDTTARDTMGSAPREHFLGLGLTEFACDDTPHPIEEGQSISQPYIVALMSG